MWHEKIPLFWCKIELFKGFQILKLNWGETKINDIMKNSIKSLFVTALMLPAFGVFSSAFAYEMVEAETVFPKAKDNQNAPSYPQVLKRKSLPSQILLMN